MPHAAGRDLSPSCEAGEGREELARDLDGVGRMNKLAVTAISLVALSTSIAAAKDQADGSVTKAARKGDVATEYTLRPDGALFRQIGKHTCQVSTEVYDFKVAQHPNDPSAIYVVKKGGLFALVPSPSDRNAASCPSAKLDALVPGVERVRDQWMYKVVDRKDTPISLVAQDTDGRVTAWDAKGVAVTVTGARDMKLNSCFGSKKSFGSYVAFVIDGDGKVAKIGGKDPRKSKHDPQRYESLDAFMAVNKVCR